MYCRRTHKEEDRVARNIGALDGAVCCCGAHHLLVAHLAGTVIAREWAGEWRAVDLLMAGKGALRRARLWAAVARWQRVVSVCDRRRPATWRFWAWKARAETRERRRAIRGALVAMMLACASGLLMLPRCT